VRKILLALALTVVAALLPWQVGHEPEALAASAFVVGRAVIRPTTIAAGQTATVETSVQARADGVVGVEAVITGARGQVVWRHAWPGESFARGQRRSYTATWTVPTDQPPGRYRFGVRVLRADGREIAKSRPTTLTLTAPRGPVRGPANPTPGPTTPTPSPATPTPPPMPAPAPPTYPFAITGSADFAANIAAGLELMKRVSPSDYAVVADNVTEIREGPQNYAWGGSRAIQISAGSARHSRAYAGAIVLHEAVHVRNWFANDLPVFGCEGEAKSLRAQAAYLRKADDPALAAWVESLIGNWC
jgi:hypothetical protein